MPELPEVETIRQDLNQVLLGQKINYLWIGKPNLVKNNLNTIKLALKSQFFVKIDRYGKLLVFHLSNQQALLIHLKMTGQLIYQSKNELVAGGHPDKRIKQTPHRHTHLIFCLQNNNHLYFNDLRQFAMIKLVKLSELPQIQANYGPDTFKTKLSWEKWQNIFKNKRSPIKTLLLNQKLVSGIGNIYADEICWKSQVLPMNYYHQIPLNKQQELWKNSHLIIKAAVLARGTTSQNYSDSTGNQGNYQKQLQVYGRANQACSRCQTLIKKIKFRGRGTHFCPHCQK